MSRRKSSKTQGLQSTNIGSEYTQDEVEFILAVERWKKEHDIRFPSYSDILRIAKSLGYRRVGDANSEEGPVDTDGTWA